MLHLRRRDGFSLIEVLIGIGIMGILAYAMMTLSVSQNNEMRALTEMLVTPGSHSISMTTANLNPVDFRFRVTGYFLRQ